MFKRIQFAIEGRSPQWASTRKAFLKVNGECKACRAKDNLEVHHIVPFHIDRRLELDPSNLMTLCKHCHLVLGHLRDYEIYNEDVKDLVNYFFAMRAKNK